MWDGGTTLGKTLPGGKHSWGRAFLEVWPTWGYWQLGHIHSSACLVGSNGVLVLLQGTEELGGPERSPGSTHWTPTHLDNALVHACLPLITLGLGLGRSHMVPLHSLLQRLQEAPWRLGNLWARGGGKQIKGGRKWSTGPVFPPPRISAAYLV